MVPTLKPVKSQYFFNGLRLTGTVMVVSAIGREAALTLVGSKRVCLHIAASCDQFCERR